MNNSNGVFAAPEHKAEIYRAHGYNTDIRDYLEQLFPKGVKEAKNAYKLFKGKTPEQTAFKIWYFLRNKAKYRRDPNFNQIIRTPKYFFGNGRRVGDCKTFSLFARSVYASIYPEFETAYKFTNYSPGRGQNPSHVYVVVKDGNNREIIIDGCWNTFNSEKKFNFALPLKYKKMIVSSLSGVNDNRAKLKMINAKTRPEIRNRIKKALQCKRDLQYMKTAFDGGHITAEVYKDFMNNMSDNLLTINGKRKPKKKLSKTERKAKRKAGAKKFGRGLATVFAAPGRGAFLAFLALNISGMASKLKKLSDLKKLATVVEKWRKFGGGEKMLLKTIAKGAKKKPLFLSKKARRKFEAKMKSINSHEETLFIGDVSGDYFNDSGIGEIAVGTVVAAAAPVVAAIIPIMLKAFGTIGRKGKQDVEQLADTGAQILAENKNGEFKQAYGGEEVGEAEEIEEPGEAEEIEEMEEPGEYENTAVSIDGLNEEQINNLPVDEIGKALGNFAAKGLNWIGKKVKKKAAKNPKLTKVLNQTTKAGDDYLTGRYLRETGVTKKLKTANKAKTMFSEAAPLLLGLTVLGGAVYAATKK